jgi:hypothetical protein
MGAPALSLVDRAGKTALDDAAQVVTNTKDRAATRRALELEPAAAEIRARGGRRASEVKESRETFQQ